MKKRLIIMGIGLALSANIAGAQNIAQWNNHAEHRAEMQTLMNEPQFDETRAKKIMDEHQRNQLEQMRQHHQNIQQNGSYHHRWNGGDTERYSQRGVGRGSGMRGGNQGDCVRY